MTAPNYKRIIEALILCHDAPMPLSQIKMALDSDLDNDTLRAILEEIKSDWSERAVQLVQLASGWRFQSAPDVLLFLDRLRAEKPTQYSRAVMETLAIIAYRQPVTRGDIEDIRGVTVSSNIIKTLEERGWIDVVGHRETVGRPALFATTKQFLDDLGLTNLRQLPPLVEQDQNSEADSAQLPLLDMPTLAVPVVAQSDESVALLDDESAMLGDTDELTRLAELDGVEPLSVADSGSDQAIKNQMSTDANQQPTSSDDDTNITTI
jgi:segregation and condensation protein B